MRCRWAAGPLARPKGFGWPRRQGKAWASPGAWPCLGTEAVELAAGQGRSEAKRFGLAEATGQGLGYPGAWPCLGTEAVELAAGQGRSQPASAKRGADALGRGR